jgi:hypothetical protein
LFLVAQGLDALDVAGSKKRQTRGGKGVVKTKKKVDCKQQTLSFFAYCFWKL